MSDDPFPPEQDPTEPVIVPQSDLPGTNSLPDQDSIPDDDPIPDETAVPPTEVMPVTRAAATPPPDPNDAIPTAVPPAQWYDDKRVVGAVIAAGVLGLFLLIGWLVWWSGDDEPDLVTSSTSTSIVVPSTLATTVPSTTVAPTTTPSSTTPATTAPPTTVAPTTAPATTTTTTTTTTVPETTTTTTVPETTTTTTTTTTVPSVTTPPEPGATVLDIIQVSPDLSRLEQLIADAGLEETIDAEGPLTIFAPSNQAIETLEVAPGGAELLADPDRLEALLLRHVVSGALDSAAIFSVSELTTVSGETLVVDGPGQTVDGALLLVVDVEAANGFLHVVNRVLTTN